MINEQLSQWETDAMYDRAVCRYFGTPTRDSGRVLALIAEVRRLQGECERWEAGAHAWEQLFNEAQQARRDLRAALETVCDTGWEMRDKQREYFRQRAQSALVASKLAEKRFDDALQQVAHLRGKEITKETNMRDTTDANDRAVDYRVWSEPFSAEPAITRRDYFAGLAMQAAYTFALHNDAIEPDGIAADAYTIADAMEKARGNSDE